MTRERKKKIGVLMLLGAIAVPLAIVSTAWACGRLATLNLNVSSARWGQEVTGRGGNYNPGPTASDVTVRLRSRNGTVVWQGRAAPPNGSITPVFTVPPVRPGYYTVVATQTLANGTPAAGTPGRDVLRIRRSGGSSAQASAAPWAAPVSGGPGASGGPPVVAGRSVDVPPLAAVGGTLAFVLLAGGGVMMLRGSRRTRTA